MIFNINNKLFVIGNGFDLYCGLESSWESFFVKKYESQINEYVDEFDRYGQSYPKKHTQTNLPNFIAFILYVYSGKDKYAKKIIKTTKFKKTWSNVESVLSEILLNKNNDFRLFIEKVISGAAKMKDNFIAYEYIKNYCKIRLDNKKYKFDSFLLEELHCFEQDFSEYLRNNLNNNQTIIGYK